MKNKLRAIFLDLDDTLIHSSAAYSKAYAEIHISNDDPYFQTAREEAKQAMGEGHPSSHNRWIYFKRYLELKDAYSALKLIELCDAYEAALKRILIRQWQELRREPLIQELKKNHRVAILTNETLRTQLLKLRAIDPDGSLFPVLFTSEEVGEEKRTGKLYTLALQRMNLQPSEVLMIGDSESDDVRGAQKAGIRARRVSEFRGGPDLKTVLTEEGVL